MNAADLFILLEPCQWRGCGATPTSEARFRGVGVAVFCAPHEHQFMRDLGKQVEADGDQEDGRGGYLSYCASVGRAPEPWWGTPPPVVTTTCSQR